MLNDHLTSTISPEALKVLRMFRIVFGSLKAHFETMERAAGVSGAEAWVLLLVEQNIGITVKELATAMNVRQPTASNLLRSLIGKGLIERQRPAEDLRIVRLHLTDAGRVVLGKIDGPAEGLLPNAISQLSAPELQHLSGSLRALLARMPQTNQAAGDIPLGMLATSHNDSSQQ